MVGLFRCLSLSPDPNLSIFHGQLLPCSPHCPYSILPKLHELFSATSATFLRLKTAEPWYWRLSFRRKLRCLGLNALTRSRELRATSVGTGVADEPPVVMSFRPALPQMRPGLKGGV